MKFEFKSKFNNFIYLLLTLLFVCTAVNVGLNFADSGDSDLSNIAVAADQPTNTNYYWTDKLAQNQLGVDFTNYTLSGSGSKTDPYLIQSETDLAFLSWTIYTGNAYNNHVSGSYYYSDIYFKQTKNLDLSAYYWQPIGIGYTRDGTSASRYFSGNYDGGGYTVSGVFTPTGSSNGYSYQGLFGYIQGRSSTQRASIANVGVIDSFIQGYQYVGGVVGYASYSATVSNVYNTGSVSGSSYYVGGVVGYASYSATVSNAYNTGLVSGSSNVGGVVGTASPSATVSNVYNTGSVSGNSYVGGVVGYASSTVSNVYNTGSVSGNSYVGGVVGYASSKSTVSNAYYGGACTLDVGIGSGGGSATKIDSPVEEWAKKEEWYSAEATLEDGTLIWDSAYPWDFENTWEFSLVPDYMLGYPTLQGMSLIISAETIFWTDSEVQTEFGVDFTSYTLSGSGSEEDPYLIQSETDLAFLSWTIYNDQVYGGSDNKDTNGSNNYFYSDVCFKQTKNLNLSAYHWQPIGIGYTRDGTSASRYFSGNYDGGGHTVSGVFTPAGSGNGYSYQGLFGYVRGRGTTQQASIVNLGVIDSFVQSYSYVGGVVGNAYFATVTNVYNTGIVSGYSEVGGVVGYAVSDVTVSNAYNAGSVSGSSSYVGGVVGNASSSSTTITNVYNTGIVSGSSSYVGGVVGYAYYATISNAYNTGSVSGSSYVGGVVGGAHGTVSNAYNIGSVSGNQRVGGVVGYALSSTTVSNVYNTGLVSGSSYVGGVVGSADATVTNTYYGGACTLDVGIGDGEGSAIKIDSPVEEWAKNEEWYSAYATGEDGALVWNSGYIWDFNFVWDIDSEQNDGYPILVKSYYWIDEYVQTEQGVDFTNYTLSRSGTETDTYLIQSETDLAFLSWTIYNNQVYGGEENKYTSGSNNYFYSDVCFKQTKNLDLSAYYWQPIGISYTRDGTSASRYFSGNYDGGGYTISGVFTPAGSSNGYDYQGLFGYVAGRSSTQQASIANLGVIDSFVQGYESVGGVVGSAGSYATISNVYNTGSVSGRYTVGGVVGSAYATVSNAYNTGLVSGSSSVGGVVGNAGSSTVINVYNTGSVSGSSRVGGVVGYVSYNSTITNAYNTGSVSGGSQVGGVVGYTSSFATISDCGVECAVITGTSNVGIFVGQKANGTIKNCYAIVDGDLSPYGSNSGTVTNCLWIAGGVKYYLGTDFSGFAWFNTDSCPIPKGLSWMGQFWTEDITSQITSSSDWTEWVA